MEKNIVVFDLDGVIFDCTHRVDAYVDGNYEAYFSRARFDTPIDAGTMVCRSFLENPKFRVLFVTGRGDHERHREDTLFMLRKHVHYGIAENQLLMRDWPIPSHQEYSDAVVKPQMIEAAGYNLDSIFMVFEDRPSIVDMWRERGVVCYQTEKGHQ